RDIASDRNRFLESPGDFLQSGFVAGDENDTRALAGERRRDRLANPARSAGHYGGPAAQPDQFDPLWASRRNSSRVFGSSLNAPRRAEVIVFEFCFCTPRI